MVGCCEDGNEPSFCIKWDEFLDYVYLCVLFCLCIFIICCVCTSVRTTAIE